MILCLVFGTAVCPVISVIYVSYICSLLVLFFFFQHFSVERMQVMTSKFFICWSGKLQWHYFLKYTLCQFFLSGTPGVHIFVYVVMFQRSQKFYFPSVFLSSSNWITQIEISSNLLVLYSASLYMLLSPCSEYFLSVVIVFNCRVSVWFLFIKSFSLLTFIIL